MGKKKEKQGQVFLAVNNQENVDIESKNDKDDCLKTANNESTMLTGDKNDRKEENEIASNGDQTPSLKKKIFSTIAVFGLSSAIALEIGVLGPTLIDMETRTSSDTKSISFLFTLRSITSLVACLAIGPLFDRVDSLFLMGIASIFGSFFLGSAPWFKNLYMFLAFMAPTGVYSSLIAIGGMLVCGYLWKKHSHALYQALNLTVSISIAMGPILSSGFVLENDNFHEQVPADVVHYKNFNDTITDRFGTHSPLIIDEESRNISAPTPDDIRVQFVYTITAGYLFVWSLFTVVVFWVFYGKIKQPTYKIKLASKTQPQKDILLCYGSFYMMLCFYAGLEVCYPGYLLTFAVTSLGWTKANGIYVTLLYQGANIMGTFTCMCLSHRIRPEKILLTDITICVISMSMLSALAKTSEYWLWILTFTLGIGYGTIVPTSFAWAESKSLAGGKFGAIYWTGYYTGGLAIPPLLGYLYVNVDTMCYVYIMLGCSVGMLFCYVLLVAVFRVHMKREHKCCEEIEIA